MKKKLIGVLILVILVAGLVVGIFLVRQTQIFKQKAAENLNQITPYNCGSNPPPIVLISLDMPLYLATSQDFTVNFTVANCSGFTWQPGQHYLGSQSPQDNSIWGTGRINWPVNVPTGNSITIQKTFTAPSSSGTYVFQWGLLSNSEWYRPYLPARLITVGTPQVCSGSNLQDCINNTPSGGILELPATTYTITNTIYINKPISIITQGTKELDGACLITSGINCAVIKASNDFTSSKMISIDNGSGGNLNGFAMDHIIVDGNKDGIASRDSFCSIYEANISAHLENAKIFNNAFINAPCKTSFKFEVSSTNSIISNNYIADNGTHSKNWADGLSLVGHSLTIMNNLFKNNTDVDLILWDGNGGNVHFNQIIHDKDTQSSYAAVMLSSWDQTLTDFTNAEFSFNNIICNKHCGFGIQLGEKTWRNGTSASIFGGIVINNNISGAIESINIDGAGTSNYPITVGGNTISNSGGFATGCGFTTGSINQNSADSVFYTKGQSADTHIAWGGSTCTLPSCNFGSQYCQPALNRCTSFTYSGWSSCVSTLQSRTVTSQTPANCIGGDTILQNSCSPAPTPTPSASPSPTPTPTESPAGTASPTPTPTGSANQILFNFKIKFQGIKTAGSDKTVKITFKNGTDTIYTNDINLTSDSLGNYTGTVYVTNVTPAVYDVYIKEPTHLAKKFSQIPPITSSLTEDWTATPLKTGDFDSNNKIDIFDIAKILSQYTAISIPVTQGNKIYDVNEDGSINILDIALVLTNYTQLQVLGD